LDLSMPPLSRTTHPVTALGAGVLLVLAAGIVRPSAAPQKSATVRPVAPVAVHGSFDQNVIPLFQETCAICHDDKHLSAGLNIAAYLDPATFVSKRDMWERILTKLRSGEMPPLTVEQPDPEQVIGLITFVQGELDRIDRTARPDPGRVTAHRLNRVEYANTVRDLLGVDFRASDEFPADDSGYGFDNNGDVLTVSPALMQKYLAAAERIAARAVGGDPLPTPAVFTRHTRVRRVSDDVTELKEILDYDADYSIKVSLTGSRGATDPPVTLVISVDGKPVKTVNVPVQMSAVNKQAGGTQRNVQDVTVFLPANEHTFRAEFVNDEEELKRIPEKSRTDQKLNIVPEFIDVAGPFPPAAPHVVQKKALVCDPASGALCVNRMLSTLARRAYRRPVTPAEVARLVATFGKAKAAGYPPKQSLQFAISAMLVSPQFLFRLEHDPGAGKVGRLTDVELASRLSYFLWSSMPDDQLLRLGEANRLHQPAVLTAQVKRLLADPKSAAFSDNFAGQWLETRSLDAVRRDAKRFPEWNTQLKEAMREETRLFFESIVRENRPVSDFIDAKYTFLNELLAKHYGIEGVTGPAFRQVELTTDQRSGVFTQGSVLTVSSYPTRTSVVLRGKYLLENVLNAPPPPPPPDVPVLDEAAVGVARSLRVQMETHRSVALCASCHSKMDPLGFALENYDAIGKWRSDDGKFPIDASGTFPNGATFDGPAAMKALLRNSMPEFTRSLAEKMLTYALGRGVESYDRAAVKKLVQDTTADGYRMQSLIQGIVKSLPFQERRGEAPAAPAASQHGPRGREHP
jgi:Protein of unknown function (DUF1592)/Protein of unknown function (DUF1588)/Protein of unknown function (DUF1587)/Protein of unknown function (DUF1585)/Protein of unknown function (DUF1595)